jgi:dATP pyrophosphohydrolase
MRIIDDIIEAHIFKIENGNLKFLLLKRSLNDIYPGLWQPITGRMNLNEKAFEAALREIEEETSLKPEEFWVVPNVNSFYNPESDTVSIIPVFVGQVKETFSIILSEEHEEFGWFSIEETLPLLSWPGQRRSAEIIYQYVNNEMLYFELVKLI